MSGWGYAQPDTFSLMHPDCRLHFTKLTFSSTIRAQFRGDIRAQTARVFENLSAVLTAAGSGLDRVVKTTVFLADMNEFAAMNEVYASYFGAHKPARSTVQAARLPRDVKVEIEAVALA